MPVIKQLPIKDAFLIMVKRPKDHRGYFSELYSEVDYPEFLHGSNDGDWKQVAISRTEKVNTIRGLHMSPYNKLCSVLSGAIYDIIVDMRPDSPTFMKWCGTFVSEANQRQVHIPALCLHGFLCLEANTRMLYMQGGTFSPDAERDCTPFDPLLDIHWPIQSSWGTDIIMSDKDKHAPRVSDRSRFPEVADLVAAPRVLIIGASGQVGSALVEEYSRQGYSVYGTHNKHAPSKEFLITVEFDLAAAASSQEVADELLGMCRPHLVIICSALTAVDSMEANAKETIWAVNVDGPSRITASARSIGAKVVVYSTEYVWDGLDGPYTEDDQTHPLNVYGHSKVAMETAVLSADPSALVLRTTVVYGPELQGKNFVYQLCRKLAKQQSIMVVVDQVSTPTYNRDLALATRQLVSAGAAGIFNVCGAERMGRYDFATEIAAVFGLSGNLIRAVRTEDLKQKAKRPLDAGMKISKALDFLKGSFKPRTVREALLDWTSNPGIHSALLVCGEYPQISGESSSSPYARL